MDEKGRILKRPVTLMKESGKLTSREQLRDCLTPLTSKAPLQNEMAVTVVNYH